MIAVNHSLALALELGLLAALARFGHTTFQAGAAGWAAAAALVVLATLLWGVFGAPKSSRRLRGVRLLIFKAAMFGTGTAALALSSATVLAAVFAVASILHLALASRLDIL